MLKFVFGRFKVNNNDTRKTSTDKVLLSLFVTSNTFSETIGTLI